MANKGKHQQAARVKRNKIAQQENRAYYQNGGAWKQPSSPREFIARRKLEDES